MKRCGKPAVRASARVRTLSAQREAPLIASRLSAHSPSWAANAAAMEAHLDALRARLRSTTRAAAPRRAPPEGTNFGVFRMQSACRL